MLAAAQAELLSAHLDGELSPRQERAVARLLQESAEARCLLAKLERDAGALRGLPACKLSHDLSEGILAALASEAPRPCLRIVAERASRKRLAVLPRSVAKRYVAAAAVMLAIGIGSLVALLGPKPVPVAVKPLPPADVVAELAPEGTAEPDLPHRLGTERLFAFPNRVATELQTAQARIPLTQSLTELEDAAVVGQLRSRLRSKDAASQIDLYCDHRGNGIERLVAVCKERGIAVRLAESAKRSTEPLAIYLESLTPEETTALLKDLGAAVAGKASPIDLCVVSAGPVTASELSRLLGGAAKDFEPASQRPLETDTVGQLIHTLPRRTSAPAMLPRRVAVAVPYATAAERSADVQALLDGYRDHRVGAMPLLLVLHVNP